MKTNRNRKTNGKQSSKAANPSDGIPPNGMDLRLYVAGQTPKSLAAVTNLRRICSEYLGSNYRIEVIDLTKNPSLARDHQILAIPTLVRSLPIPIRKIIGDLSDTEQVVVGLDIQRDRKRKKPVMAGAAF